MATDAPTTPESPPTPPDPQAAPAAKSTGKRNILLVAGLIAFVMVAEAAVFYMLGIGTPPAREPDSQKAADTTETEAEKPEDQFAEVDIDTFNVTNTQAASDVVIHISFKLSALVAKGQEIDFDNAANKTHKARVREAVVEVARSASIEELNDPALTTFKRLIRERINKVLRRSYVVEAIISDFKIIEQ